MRRTRTVALACGFAWLACACGPDEPTSRELAPPASESPFDVTFADATERAGLRFEHVNGAFGQKLLPETLGSGCAFLDFDGDGKLDLFFVNSSQWPGHEPSGAASARCALYRGHGDGTFEDVSASSGADLSLYGMGCAVADFDGDRDDDLFVTAVDGNVLLENDGGHFRDVTEAAGVASGRWRDRAGVEHPDWSTAALWLDVEPDGDLDLFVGNYCEWTPETDIFTTLDGVTKAFTTPDRYTGLPCRLYANDGKGKFIESGAAAGFGPHLGKALGAAVWDFDGDGRCEIAVANDTRPNFLFQNRGGARFEEAGISLGVAYDENGRARAGMGIDVAEYGNDGVPGIAIGNFASEAMSLYRWNGTLFRGAADRAGLAGPTTAPLTFGVAFLDLDLDGIQDLAVVNGHIEPDVARFAASQSHAQSAQLFRGIPGGTFQDVSASAGADFTRARVGRGLAAGDVDGDGDLDLVVTSNGGRAVLLENRAQQTKPRNFLRVLLRGKGSNTAALGARVALTAGGATQVRFARTGSSYLSQSERALTFGLGAATRVDALEVRWPSGERSTHAPTAIDTTLTIDEP